MTQPAKVQEPSMEEILASIRRIIADDEAKPAAAEKPSSPAAPAKAEKSAAPPPAKAPVMNDIPPSVIPAAQAAEGVRGVWLVNNESGERLSVMVFENEACADALFTAIGGEPGTEVREGDGNDAPHEGEKVKVHTETREFAGRA